MHLAKSGRVTISNMSNSSKSIYHEQRTDALTDINKNIFKYTNVFKGFYINLSEKVILYINYMFTTRLHSLISRYLKSSLKNRATFIFLFVIFLTPEFKTSR